ncbi:uncharacterized protein LOC143037016 [Oratosquilla oratoria]|uniref:uncharacterized protein LOC143037016 n=1 Tax=Oratosquilla oratoria TaxID=337810 RepID=UPI003F7777B7
MSHLIALVLAYAKGLHSGLGKFISLKDVTLEDLTEATDDYERKATTLLQDRNTYEVVPYYPTSKLQKRVEGELRKLKEVHLITEREWERMRPGDSVIPKFYDSLKMHKEGVPLRPIIAFRGSPTYNLASVLAKRLRPSVVNSIRMLKNLSEFLEKIRDIRVESDEVMVSFDVKSMFTSLPQDLVKRAVLSAMDETRGYLDNENLSTSELMRLVNLCLDSTIFNFRDTVCHQRIETPVGSPISVILAEITMERFENEILSAAPTSLKLWTRYVDDVFAILKDRDVDGFLEQLNG